MNRTAPLVTRSDDGYVVFTRTMSVAPSSSPNIMRVATHDLENVGYNRIGPFTAVLKPQNLDQHSGRTSEFNGGSFLKIDDADDFDLTKSFTIAARIRTTSDGTIFSKCSVEGPWIPGGKAFFIRGGRLTYDIGWVGAANSRKRVDDGNWHDVAMTWDDRTGRVSFFIDGRKNGGGNLKPKKPLDRKMVAKIGFAAGDFPKTSHFSGEIEAVGVWDTNLDLDDIGRLKLNASPEGAAAVWNLNQLAADGVVHGSGPKTCPAEIVRGEGTRSPRSILAGVAGGRKFKHTLSSADGRSLNLEFGSGDRQSDIVLWTASVDARLNFDQLRQIAAEVQEKVQPENLVERVQQSSEPRWPEVITTTPVVGDENGLFAVDVLTPPANNPWLARLRVYRPRLLRRWGPHGGVQLGRRCVAGERVDVAAK